MYRHTLTTFYCTEMDEREETFVRSSAVLTIEHWSIPHSRTRFGIAAKRV